MTIVRYVAIVEKHVSYVLDYYPNEKLALYSEYARAIIGDFATEEEAEHAIKQIRLEQ